MVGPDGMSEASSRKFAPEKWMAKEDDPASFWVVSAYFSGLLLLNFQGVSLFFLSGETGGFKPKLITLEAGGYCRK